MPKKSCYSSKCKEWDSSTSDSCSSHEHSSFESCDLKCEKIIIKKGAPGSTGATGAPGAQGPPGPTGVTGAPGPSVLDDCCKQKVHAVVVDDAGQSFRDENGKCQRVEVCFQKICDHVVWHIQPFDVLLKGTAFSGVTGGTGSTAGQKTIIYLAADACDLKPLVPCDNLLHKATSSKVIVGQDEDGNAILEDGIPKPYEAVIAYAYPEDKHVYPAEAIIEWPSVSKESLVKFPDALDNLTCILNKGTLANSLTPIGCTAGQLVVDVLCSETDPAGQFCPDTSLINPLTGQLYQDLQGTLEEQEQQYLDANTIRFNAIAGVWMARSFATSDRPSCCLPLIHQH